MRVLHDLRAIVQEIVRPVMRRSYDPTAIEIDSMQSHLSFEHVHNSKSITCDRCQSHVTMRPIARPLAKGRAIDRAGGRELVATQLRAKYHSLTGLSDLVFSTHSTSHGIGPGIALSS